MSTFGIPTDKPTNLGTVEGLLDELSVRLRRTDFLSTRIKESLVGAYPVCEGDNSKPTGIVEKLSILCSYVASINDTLGDVAGTLSGDYE